VADLQDGQPPLVQPPGHERLLLADPTVRAVKIHETAFEAFMTDTDLAFAIAIQMVQNVGNLCSCPVGPACLVSKISTIQDATRFTTAQRFQVCR
jgi:hypothetical protein